jgi:hypothetical protein
MNNSCSKSLELRILSKGTRTPSQTYGRSSKLLLFKFRLPWSVVSWNPIRHQTTYHLLS